VRLLLIALGGEVLGENGFGFAFEFAVFEGGGVESGDGVAVEVAGDFEAYFACIDFALGDGGFVAVETGEGARELVAVLFDFQDEVDITTRAGGGPFPGAGGVVARLSRRCVGRIRGGCGQKKSGKQKRRDGETGAHGSSKCWGSSISNVAEQAKRKDVPRLLRYLCALCLLT
jgi:hypothetical protein